MRRRILITGAVFSGFILSAITLWSLLPKQYSIAVRLQQATVFWNDDEAFFFLGTNTTGRTQDALLARLSKTRYGYWLLYMGGGLRFMGPGTVAYHLLPTGELNEVALPPDAPSYGEWSLHDGRLQFSAVSNDRGKQPSGYRWDGDKFIAVSRQDQQQSPADSTLSPDDDEDDSGFSGPIPASSRKAFRAAGWHYKSFTGYENRAAQAVLPFSLGSHSFELSFTKASMPRSALDALDNPASGISRIEISGAALPAPRALWTNRGWEPLSKKEFDDRAQRYGRVEQPPYMFWVWIAVLVLAGIFKLSGWGYLLFSWLGLKRRVLNNMPTSFSFPPATPTQFPQLDATELERYTRGFESYGFVRLLDFSLVSNAAKPIPSFCRLFVHTRHHCFAEVSQIFLQNKAPLPLRCSIQSSLDDGWTLGFSDRKPQAASSLVRRRKAISISLPGTPTYELLQRFLQMREQICQDLGISCLKEHTVDDYISKVQRTAAEMREAVKDKNFVTRIPEVYYRKLALLKTSPEYVWLGDYPRQAELRKQGRRVPSLTP